MLKIEPTLDVGLQQSPPFAFTGSKVGVKKRSKSWRTIILSHQLQVVLETIQLTAFVEGAQVYLDSELLMTITMFNGPFFSLSDMVEKKVHSDLWNFSLLLQHILNSTYA